MSKIIAIQQLDKIDPNATYILLINPEKIPHLVYIEEGKYFTLTYNESVCGENFDTYLKKLKRLKKKMIFLKLKNVRGDASSEFQQFTAADSSSITCFVPVKNCVLPESKAQMIHELIPELYENQIIESAYHLNATEILNESEEFTLSVYTKKMIFSYIQHLKKKDVSRK